MSAPVSLQRMTVYNLFLGSEKNSLQIDKAELGLVGREQNMQGTGEKRRLCMPCLSGYYSHDGSWGDFWAQSVVDGAGNPSD